MKFYSFIIYFSVWFLGLSTLCQWAVLNATSYVLLPGIWCLCHDFNLEDFIYLNQLPFKQIMDRDFYSCSLLRYLKMCLDFVIKRNVTSFKSNLVSSKFTYTICICIHTQIHVHTINRLGSIVKYSEAN